MKLVVLEGPAARPSFEVFQDRTLIGRAPECDVLVFDAQVSRYHAQILRLGDAFFLESLQAANPAIVNDRVATTRRKLADGDLIVLGTIVIQVDLPQATLLPDPSPTPGAVFLDSLMPTPGPHQTLPPSARPPQLEQTPARPPVTPGAEPRSVPTPTPGPSMIPASKLSLPESQPALSTPVSPPPQAVSRPAADPRPEPSADREHLLRPARPEIRPQLTPREQLRAIAARIGAAGQRIQTRLASQASLPQVAPTDEAVVSHLLAEHEMLGGDSELARLATLLSERLGNQTDIRALYRLGADAGELAAWTRLAQQSIAEAARLAELLGIHRTL